MTLHFQLFKRSVLSFKTSLLAYQPTILPACQPTSLPSYQPTILPDLAGLPEFRPDLSDARLGLISCAACATPRHSGQTLAGTVLIGGITIDWPAARNPASSAVWLVGATVTSQQAVSIVQTNSESNKRVSSWQTVQILSAACRVPGGRKSQHIFQSCRLFEYCTKKIQLCELDLKHFFAILNG